METVLMKGVRCVAVGMLPAPNKFHDIGFVEILIFLRRQRGSELYYNDQGRFEAKSQELRATDGEGLSLRQYTYLGTK
jgi:hypothetical protein